MQEKGGDKMSDTKEGFDAKNAYTSTWEDVDIVESDVELDVTDVVGPDHDPPQKVGDIKTWCGCLLLVFVVLYSLGVYVSSPNL